MPQDAFTIKHIAKSLNDILKSGKINKITQPEKEELHFFIYANGNTFKLVLNANSQNAHIGLTDAEKLSPAVPPNFCALLRKRLLGAEIMQIKQVEFERIIAIELHSICEFSESDLVLYAEIMGKYSNLILCEKGIILGALKSTPLEENNKRILFSGAKYNLPQPQNKISPFDSENVKNLVKNFYGGDVYNFSKYIFDNVLGLAYSSAEIIAQDFFNNTTKIETKNNIADAIIKTNDQIVDVNIKTSDRIAEDFAEFLKNHIDCDDLKPIVAYDNEKPVDFYCADSKFIAYDKKYFDNILTAQQAYYTLKNSIKTFLDKKKKLENAISARKKKEEKKLAILLDRKQSCNNIETNRIYGELITSNIYALKNQQEYCEVVNYYDENCQTIKIPLDKSLTPSGNAQKYYKKYNKQKRTLVAVEPQIQSVNQELDYISSIVGAINYAENVEDLTEIENELLDNETLKNRQTKTVKKIKENIIPFRKFLYNGYEILVGRNNIQNERLLKFAKDNDVWLHTQKYHSSHVIILTNGKSLKDVDQSVLLFAGELCAYFSEAKDGSKVPIDYCERKFVKKPPKTPSGFVTYTNFNSFLVTPQRHFDFEML